MYPTRAAAVPATAEEVRRSDGARIPAADAARSGTARSARVQMILPGQALPSWAHRGLSPPSRWVVSTGCRNRVAGNLAAVYRCPAFYQGRKLLSRPPAQRQSFSTAKCTAASGRCQGRQPGRWIPQQSVSMRRGAVRLGKSGRSSKAASTASVPYGRPLPGADHGIAQQASARMQLSWRALTCCRGTT